MELIISVFLLTYVFLIVIALLHQGLRYGSETGRVTQAGLFAETLMAEMRDWASSPENFRSDWSPYNGELRHPDYPGFKANCKTIREDTPLSRLNWLSSPCSGLEKPHGPNERVFKGSAVWVQLVVPVGQGGREIRLVTLIAQPELPLPTGVQISQTSAGTSLAPEERASFEATLDLDTEAMWLWSVGPRGAPGVEPGNATLGNTTARDGSGAEVVNKVVLNPLPTAPQWGYAPGRIGVRAYTRFQGRTFSAEEWLSVAGP